MKSYNTTIAVLCLITAIFYGCDQNLTSTDNNAADTDTVLADTSGTKDTIANKPQKPVTEEGINAEFIDYNTIKVNGKVGFYANIKQLVAALGTADSVYKVTDKSTRYECGTFFGSNISIVYIKGAEFERHQDSIVYRAVSFKDTATFVDAGKLKLNAATSLEEVKKLFPKSVKNSHVIAAAGFKAQVIAVSLPIAARESEDKWVLLFDKTTGKLLRFEYWIPC